LISHLAALRKERSVSLDRDLGEGGGEGEEGGMLVLNIQHYLLERKGKVGGGISRVSTYSKNAARWGGDGELKGDRSARRVRKRQRERGGGVAEETGTTDLAYYVTLTTWEDRDRLEQAKEGESPSRCQADRDRPEDRQE